MVLAAISILPFDRQLETRATDPQLDQDRMVRMANLLGVPHEKHDVAKALSREALVSTRGWGGHATAWRLSGCSARANAGAAAAWNVYMRTVSLVPQRLARFSVTLMT